jgi:hypothetical protein
MGVQRRPAAVGAPASFFMRFDPFVAEDLPLAIAVLRVMLRVGGRSRKNNHRREVDRHNTKNKREECGGDREKFGLGFPKLVYR